MFLNPSEWLDREPTASLTSNRAEGPLDFDEAIVRLPTRLILDLLFLDLYLPILQ